MTKYCAQLDDKTLLEISGSDARNFLQNLISNDMGKVDATNGLYAFLLSAQGKYLHDFFLSQTTTKAGEDCFLLEVAKERSADLKRRLTMLKLRADVVLEEKTDVGVYAVWPVTNTNGTFGVQSEDDKISLNDGRADNLCHRVYSPNTLEADATNEQFRSYLADKGVATGHTDFIIDKTTMMEAGLDGQHAVSWTKGCFVGQELTARMKYRGLVKRILVPTKQTIPAETPLLLDGKTVGTMQSDRFALVKRDAITFDESSLETPTGEAVSFLKPDWWDRAEATSAKT
ncbi:MAG: YgfZ/GcvT domain-containing protein [Alphaproteobacteria bacterium]